ncbi:hypothetical protein, partial [Vibrio atlanticus]|uniref:hypothetical protein n=1 Tax=Vibrio atlanticus TaxID=693153 RepID=UPI00354B8FA3
LQVQSYNLLTKVASGLFNTRDLVLAAQHLNPYFLYVYYSVFSLKNSHCSNNVALVRGSIVIHKFKYKELSKVEDKKVYKA